MNSSHDVSQIADHLFRHEAGKMVAVLTRIFGLQNIELAEDVVQEAFAKALKDWKIRIPDNPSAWLMQTAKNKTIDVLRRQKHHKSFADEFGYLLKSGYTDAHTVNQLFLDHEIKDSQLRMIFACCHPHLGEAEQILLTLKACSGFSIEEAANALLIKYDSAKKKLQRAKTRIRAEGISFEIPTGAALVSRLESVLRIIYLMFNEGYKSSTAEEVIRKDICEEAMRLAILLTDHHLTQSPKTDALVALMCFQVARFDARIDDVGDIVLLEDQDRSTWNRSLIQHGEFYLNRSAVGDHVSEYHLQAAIALTHLQASSIETTNWEFIYGLYTQLAALNPSPLIFLNKAIVRSKVDTPNEALSEIMAIAHIESLCQQNYLFGVAIAALYAEKGDHTKARSFLNEALTIAPTKAERRLLKRKLRLLPD